MTDETNGIKKLADEFLSNPENMELDNSEPEKEEVQNTEIFKLKSNPNVYIEYPYSGKAKGFYLDLGNDGVAILAERETEDVAERINNNFITDKRKDTINYAVTLDSASKVSALSQNMLQDSVDRENGHWKQYLQSERGKLSFSSPKLADDDSKKATGKKAMLRARALMGLGGLVSIPLFRSGFWITIKAPSESSLIELNRRIAEEKIALGRQTHGLAFSNQEAYMTSWLVDFALEHLYDTSLANDEDIKSKISALDYHTVLWGLAIAIYPKGFSYSRAITTPEGIRNRQLVTAIINVSKIFWVDNNYFTEEQKAHMTLRQAGSVTDEMLDKYQKTIKLGTGRDVEILPGITFTLKVPTISEQVDSTHKWVTDLNALIDSTFTTASPDDEERNRMLAIHSRTSQARAYSGWVASIDVEGDKIEEREDIDEFLNDISQKEEYVEKFINEVKRFINDATCSLVAIPEVDGTEDYESLPRFPQLIPINTAAIFFILLVQQVAKTVMKKQLV